MNDVIGLLATKEKLSGEDLYKLQGMLAWYWGEEFDEIEVERVNQNYAVIKLSY